MSYIVPNSNKPVRCNRCPFIDADSLNCTLMEDSYKYIELAYQHIHCPLIELPPHGRLGDLDALYEEISNGNKAYNGFDGYDGKYPNVGNVDDCLDAIKYADTVIEAEGSET